VALEVSDGYHFVIYRALDTPLLTPTPTFTTARRSVSFTCVRQLLAYPECGHPTLGGQVVHIVRGPPLTDFDLAANVYRGV
jgi:hypothetical protein